MDAPAGSTADGLLAPSPELALALEACRRLGSSDRLALLRELGRWNVALEAWADTDFVPQGSSARPLRPSQPVPVLWPDEQDGQDRRSSAAAACVTGCPWCRRPLTVIGSPVRGAPGSDANSFPTYNNFTTVSGMPRPFAYTTILYGPRCHSYFLGALVLGEGLRRFGGLAPNRILLLMHTPDVPKAYLDALTRAGWTCREVEYIREVTFGLFHNWRKSRFIDVFTKLRALQLVDFEKVLMLDLDLLIRESSRTGAKETACEIGGLPSLFNLRAPAAMKRGPPVPLHGQELAYSLLWGHPTRREGDALPPHQQASGINAGVMLLQPDPALFTQIDQEVHDWYHPEHYATYMPEQEYLGRLYGTFDRWTHISCRFNFEVDKNERIPHDFTEAHEVIRAAGAPEHVLHVGASVLHYSGSGVKPWDLLSCAGEPFGSLLIDSAEEVGPYLRRLTIEGPGSRLDGYKDQQRLWAAMLEWLAQLADVSSRLAKEGCDVVELVRAGLARDAEADAAAQSGWSSPGDRPSEP
ncbi:unnamed protein product [Polarella glacialis]|uniref:Hexosyltransferase n=1 Tax=Polarella glacialis TaxID=89957 RepID=A0A813G970_POLGL|nr:unnamed protein product [Polarella glacialis]